MQPMQYVISWNKIELDVGLLQEILQRGIRMVI